MRPLEYDFRGRRQVISGEEVALIELLATRRGPDRRSFPERMWAGTYNTARDRQRAEQQLRWAVKKRGGMVLISLYPEVTNSRTSRESHIRVRHRKLEALKRSYKVTNFGACVDRIRHTGVWWFE